MGNGLDDFDSFHDDDNGSLLATITASTMRADMLSEKITASAAEPNTVSISGVRPIRDGPRAWPCRYQRRLF